MVLERWRSSHSLSGSGLTVKPRAKRHHAPRKSGPHTWAKDQPSPRPAPTRTRRMLKTSRPQRLIRSLREAAGFPNIEMAQASPNPPRLTSTHQGQRLIGADRHRPETHRSSRPGRLTPYRLHTGRPSRSSRRCSARGTGSDQGRAPSSFRAIHDRVRRQGRDRASGELADPHPVGSRSRDRPFETDGLRSGRRHV